MGIILLVKGLIRELRTKSSKATLDSQRGIRIEGECQYMAHDTLPDHVQYLSLSSVLCTVVPST